MLYDADKVKEAASVTDEKQLYHAQLDIFLDPNDPTVIAEAKKPAFRTNGLQRRSARRFTK